VAMVQWLYFESDSISREAGVSKVQIEVSAGEKTRSQEPYDNERIDD
jgi:hypothetical protein